MIKTCYVCGQPEDGKHILGGERPGSPCVECGAEGTILVEGFGSFCLDHFKEVMVK